MTSEQPPRPAARSRDGEGITVGYDVHLRLHAAGCAHGRPDPPYHRADGLPDEVPDVPTRVVAYAAEGPRREIHADACDCGPTGKTPFCDHSGAYAERSRSGPGPAGRAPRGAPDG